MILADRSDHADATHLLGVVAMQQSEDELIGRAIALEPGCASYHGTLGEAWPAKRTPSFSAG